ncbi:MAG: hypothetical protein WDM77_05605 [Steroidobacteraceae bacterium]
MSVPLRVALLLTAAALCACTLPHSAPGPPANGTVVLPSPQLIAAVQRDTDRIDQSTDSTERTRLLATATTNAQQCIAQTPQNGDCHYVWAKVLGLTARERPVQAVALLKEMLANLTRAEALNPAFDHAGPAAVKCRGYCCVPRVGRWGPGDADAAVLAAQRALDRDPAYPPNLITLAQAQAKSDARDAARATFVKAGVAVAAWPAVTAEETAGRAAWQHEVDQGIQDLR